MSSLLANKLGNMLRKIMDLTHGYAGVSFDYDFPELIEKAEQLIKESRGPDELEKLRENNGILRQEILSLNKKVDMLQEEVFVLQILK